MQFHSTHTHFRKQDQWFSDGLAHSHKGTAKIQSMSSSSPEHPQIEGFAPSHCKAAAQPQDWEDWDWDWGGGGGGGQWESYCNVKTVRTTTPDRPALLPRASCAGPDQRGS